MGRGIDYSPIGSTVNRDPDTGIRFGVLPMQSLGEGAWDEFETKYDASCPHCGSDVPESTEFTSGNRPDGSSWGLWATCAECGKAFSEDDQYGDEPSGHEYDDGACKAFVDSSGDAWFTRSPYYTRAAFCSPCAPGACYLTSPCDDGERAFCPGPEWFDDDNPAPFPIYSVATSELVTT